MRVSRILIAGAAALAGCGVLGTAGAQASSVTAATWTKQTPAAHPSARYLSAMAYDAATGTEVLFGGLADGKYPADTWTWG
jgi:spermidine/putrescine-binding protein